MYGFYIYILGPYRENLLFRPIRYVKFNNGKHVKENY